jgi:hypothetical protein
MAAHATDVEVLNDIEEDRALVGMSSDGIFKLLGDELAKNEAVREVLTPFAHNSIL